jgi:hypothetical protein
VGKVAIDAKADKESATLAGLAADLEAKAITEAEYDRRVLELV